MHQDEAIVLRSVDFSETSLILTLFSRGSGKIRAIAKGGRRLKSSFESSLDLLSRVRITWIGKHSDALDILTESKLLHRFRVHKGNYAGLYASYAVVELLHEFTEEGESGVELFDLLRFSLEDFETGTYVMRTLLRFEWILLERLGYRPSLKHCAECGCEVRTDERGRITFGHLSGGVLCGNCREGLSQLAVVRVSALELIERLSSHSGPIAEDFQRREWTRFPVDRSLLGEARGLTTHYISHLLGRKPRLYDQLPIISKNDREP